MYYHMTIAGLERDLKLFPVNDDLQIAAFILFGDVEMTEVAARELIARAPEFDIILTAEAKSIALAHEMARAAGRNDYIIARKHVKVYMENPISTTAVSITTPGVQELFLGQDDVDLIKGKRVLIVDDVVSTGGSLLSLEALVEAAGGEIAGKMFVLAEGDAAERDDVIYLEKLPLFDADGNPLS